MWLLLTLFYVQSGGMITLDHVRADPFGPFSTEEKCMAKRESVVNYNGEPIPQGADVAWSDTVCIPIKPYPPIVLRDDQ